MTKPEFVEFAHYRFVRDAKGEVVALPAQGPDEKILLVVDCERWGLARLHLFEGAASRADTFAAFEEEMTRLAPIRSELLSRIVSWGRDAEALYYADEMRDGEPLPDYLVRVGGVPFPVAADWISRFLGLFASISPRPPSMKQFSMQNFEVVLDRSGKAVPVFSEFHGWTRPGARVREHRVEWQFAQIFCSLVAGVPIRPFGPDFLPWNFDELDPDVREAILAVLREEGGDRAAVRFRETLARLAKTREEGGPEAPLPLLPLREWLRSELAAANPGEPEQHLPESYDPTDEPYATPSRVRGAAVNLQVVPGPATLPREAWLPQHHDATRRPGKRALQQLQVNYLEDLESVTLFGEERVEGVALDWLIAAGGPVSRELAICLAASVELALDAIEQPVGAGAVWWLPPENVFLLTGTRSAAASARYLERRGEAGWSEVAVKLRLHQTVETLKDGVNLPSAVRHHSRLPGKPFEPARRSAIAVPLFWYCLTGSRFQWRNRAEHPLVEEALAHRFERYRQQLREDPGEVTESFFEVFRRDLELGAPTSNETEGEREPLATTEEAMQAALDESEIEPPRGSDVDEKSDERDSPAPASADATVPARAPILLWSAIAGVVVACVVGFYLSGWALRLGPFAETAEIAFAAPAFQVAENDAAEVARVATGEFLVAEGSPQSLRLLPMLRRLEEPAIRREVVLWLENLAGKGNGAASRVLGLLSYANGAPIREVAAHFAEGGAKGDAESVYRLAALRWNQAEGGIDLETVAALESVAKSGHAAAGELLALVRLEEGDPAAARQWIETSARKEWVPAFRQLGLFHALGIGGPIDPPAAASQFRLAAERGEVRAMYEYGRCLAAGFGVPTSFPEAQRWMKTAAALGHGSALRWCLDRGMAIETGEGG